LEDEGHKLDKPASNTAIRPPTFLISKRTAELLGVFYVVVVLEFEMVALFLRHTPLFVTVNTLQISVHVPASKTSD
jgi:hypothetical protein